MRRRAGVLSPKRRRRARGWHGPFGWKKWQTVAAAAAGVALLGLTGLLVLAATLPDPERVSLHAGEVRLYDRTGTRLVADITGGGEVRTHVSIQDIATDLQNATVAAEDRHFYENRLFGVDFGRLLKAMTVDLLHRRAEQGASTITQQLAKIELLSGEGGPSRTLARKLKEAILATEIEQRFNKDKILELYLNAIYYGHHSYGIEAASRVYFGKHAKDLTLAQASFLAGLPQAPSYYDPQTNYDGAKERQRYVLDQVVRDGYASRAAADTAIALDLRPQLKYKVEAASGPAPHFVQYVLGQLQANYDRDVINAGGVQVTTTLDLDAQAAANTAIENGLPKLKQNRANNAALLAENPNNGEILAYVGSADFNNVNGDIGGQNDIVQLPREPGSSFKPYVYVTGISNRSFDTLTTFDDSPGTLPSAVSDFDGRFEGQMRLRRALVESRNVPAEQAMQKAGVNNVIETAQRFGIGSTKLQPNLSTAIGSSDVKMIEHAEAYGVFATEGMKHAPVAILKVLTGDGKDITIAPEGAQRVIDPAPAYIIDNVLQGYTAFWHLGIDQWHMAAKSGTSSVQSGRTRDAWMMAYNPDLLVATWAGRTSSNPNADQSTYSLFGTSVGQSITTPFLKAAFSDGKWKHNFQQPPGVIQASCDPGAGGPAGTTAPAGGELLVSGDSGSGCAPTTPTPTPSVEPSATPNESPSPGGTPPPSPIISFPSASPKPSPSPSP